MVTLNNRSENNVTLNLDDTAGNLDDAADNLDDTADNLDDTASNLDDTAGNLDESVNQPNPTSQKSFCGNSQSSDSVGKVVSIYVQILSNIGL